MTIHKFLVLALLIGSIFTANSSAIKAQSDTLEQLPCIIINNTLILLHRSHRCEQILHGSTNSLELLQTLQQLLPLNEDILKALREMGLIEWEQALREMAAQGIPPGQLPSIINSLPGSSLPIPSGFQVPQLPFGAMRAQGSGVGVSVTQTGGNPATVTIISGSDQRTFTVPDKNGGS